jgi:hypothetical protein
LLVGVGPEGLEPVHVAVQELGGLRVLGKLFALALLLQNNLLLLVKLIQDLKEKLLF